MKIVAIVPARGGSQGIPRKNARLLNGRPLLEYVLRAALECPLIDEIYVSTDDAELQQISEQTGIPVLVRPESLSGPDITIDEVIVDAVESLECNGAKYDYVVTLQATYPLLKTLTIEKAIRQCINTGLDTVLTVVPDTHLSWSKDSQGTLSPVYTKRKNRQDLTPHFRESGAVVVATGKTLKTGSRFGDKLGVVEVGKSEAIDIDDYFDWWLAEKSLKRKKICFHVLGNHQSGLGHVYRALTLADRLIDHELSFLINDQSEMAAELIKRRFYPVRMVAPGHELESLLQAPPDLIINDILETDKIFMKALRAHEIPTINFEDEGPGSLQADYVINAMFGPHPNRTDGRVFHGVEYCCLRDEFYSHEPIPSKDSVENILLIFGGTDPSGMTLTLFRWLDEISGPWKITLIAGIGFSRMAELNTLRKSAKHEVEVVVDTKVISRYMSRADLAATSAGRTVFELASLGVPMAVVAHNPREGYHQFARYSAGTVFLGNGLALTRENFQLTMKEMINSPLLRGKMRSILLDSDVRNGIDRVIQVIEQALSPMPISINGSYRDLNAGHHNAFTADHREEGLPQLVHH